jgi:hypothetical protein
MATTFLETISSILKKSPAKQSQRSSRRHPVSLTGERLEAREMMTVNAPIALLNPGFYPVSSAAIVAHFGEWDIEGLVDPTIRSTALADYHSDGRITRNDMLGIFNAATHGGAYLNNVEFNDLQTLVSDAAWVGMPDYVQNLATKALNDGPTGAYTQLGMMYIPAAPYLQTIYQSIAAATLQGEINVWFKGADRPDANVTIDNTSYAPTYQPYSGQLWVGQPSFADVKQGADGDCWLLASLAEVADRNPAAIEDMFVDNGDGTYTVRFYNNGVADYVTVDSYLPTYEGTALFDAPITPITGGSTPVLWAALAEKAYAEEFTGSYQGMNYGYSSVGLNRITGQTTAVFDTDSDASTLASEISTAWSQGQYIVLNSVSDEVNPNGINVQTRSPNIVPDHSYAMTGYVGNDMVLFNPWGEYGGWLGGTHYAGYVVEDATDLSDDFSDWAQTTGAASSVGSTQSPMAGSPAPDATMIGLSLSQFATNPVRTDNQPTAASGQQTPSAMFVPMSQIQGETGTSKWTPTDTGSLDNFASTNSPLWSNKTAATDAALAELYG